MHSLTKVRGAAKSKKAVSQNQQLDQLSEDGVGANADIFIQLVEPDYKLRLAYWKQQPQTIAGMLKGHVKLHEPDIAFQSEFFQEHEQELPGRETCLEMFGRRGRIYEHLTRHKFKYIDFNELVPELCEAALKMSQLLVRMHAQYKREKTGEIRECFACPAEDIDLTRGYDCIWICWGHGYLKEVDSLRLLAKCREALLKDRDSSKPGLIFNKETVTKEDEKPCKDEDQQLVLRPVEYYRALFKTAGFLIIGESRKTIGEGMDDSVMFALKPEQVLEEAAVKKSETEQLLDALC